MKRQFAYLLLTVMLSLPIMLGCGENNDVVGVVDSTPPAPAEIYRISATKHYLGSTSYSYWSSACTWLNISGDTLTLRGGSNSISIGGGYWGSGGNSGPIGVVEIRVIGNVNAATHSIDGSSLGTASYSELGPRWATRPNLPTGELRISSWDTLRNIATGSFRFIGVLTHAFFRTGHNDTLCVTDGSFRASVNRRR